MTYPVYKSIISQEYEIFSAYQILKLHSSGKIHFDTELSRWYFL